MAWLPGHPSPLLLELDLTGDVLETVPDDPIARLQARGKPRLRLLVERLGDAAGDDRVRGLVAKVGRSELPLARAQELRDAVRAFAASGKPTVAWAETLGEFASASVAYYLASGFGEVWVQPSGDVGFTGVAGERLFLRGLLDRLGVEPQLDQRHEYKNAADLLLRTGFTEAHREAATRLAESAYEQLVAGVAAARGLTEEQVRDLVDRAPLTAAEARDAGLIDRVGYRDEVYDDVRRRLGTEPQLLFLDRYKKRATLERAVAKVTSRDRSYVALVEGVGGVAVGRSRRSGLSGHVMGSDTVSAAFRTAVRDDDAKAIVFRVDSPGGSYVASDTIWRSVSLARDAGKPVVVSMGSMAGSGGYFVACPADLVVAQPATLTGSIGVFGGKTVISGMLGKVDLHGDGVQAGEHARMFSAWRRFTDAEWDRLQLWLDRVYDDFVARVAQGRRLSTDQVHEVARGRVWTGADAKDVGLVDELGGLEAATTIARERARLRATAPLRPVPHLPAIARLRPPRSSDDPRGTIASAAHLVGWGGFAGIAAALGLPESGPLVMPLRRPLS